MGESNARFPFAVGNGTPSGSPQGQGDYGYIEALQKASLVHNGTNNVSVTLYLPYAAGPANAQGTFYPQISEIWVDVTTAWNSATSDTLSVGKTAGGTEFVSGVDGKTATGRIIPTFTAAQLTAMQNVGQNTVVVTMTPVGSASAGATTVYVRYTCGQSLNPAITG